MDGGAPRSGDAGAAAVEEPGQVLDLGFPGHPGETGGTPGQHRGHEQTFGGPYAGIPQLKAGALQSIGGLEHQAVVLHRGGGPHFHQSFQVDVDGTLSQPAAPGGGQLHPAGTVEQRRQIKHRAAHGPRRPGGNPAAYLPGGTEVHPAVQVFGLPADAPQDLQRGVKIGQIRHIVQGHRPVAEHRCRQNRQKAVFGSGQSRPALQRTPARNTQIFHLSPPFPPRGAGRPSGCFDVPDYAKGAKRVSFGAKNRNF